MINNEMLEEVERVLNEEFENSLTKRQIINIDNKLDLYLHDREELDRMFVLKYSCLIKNTINNYMDTMVHPNNIKKYYGINNIDYSIQRTLSNLCDDIEVNPIRDERLEDYVSYVERDLQLEIKYNQKIFSLTK